MILELTLHNVTHHMIMKRNTKATDQYSILINDYNTFVGHVHVSQNPVTMFSQQIHY